MTEVMRGEDRLREVASEVTHRISALQPDGTPAARARGIILSPDGTKLLVIRRQKAGVAPYSVYPGGGLIGDETIIEGLTREFSEELSFTPADWMSLGMPSDAYKGEAYVVVQTHEEKPAHLHADSPEAHDLSGNSYFLEWVTLLQVPQINLLPAAITDIVTEVLQP